MYIVLSRSKQPLICSYHFKTYHMENSIIKRICHSCSCNEQEAQEYLDDEIQNLKELKELDDLRYNDMEVACNNLGLEQDHVQYFIHALAVC